MRNLASQESCIIVGRSGFHVFKDNPDALSIFIIAEREARIKRACQLLQQTDKNIAEVAYACGFTDPKYFSRSFKQSTGLSPTEYREKH